jgi:hypothetical protein
MTLENPTYFGGGILEPYKPIPHNFSSGISEAKNQLELPMMPLPDRRPAQDQSYSFLHNIALMTAICTAPAIMHAEPIPAGDYSSYFIHFADSSLINFAHINDRYLTISLTSRQSGMAERESARDEELETIFIGLAKKWREETGGYSLTGRRYAHLAYQSILLLAGKNKDEVVSLILRELQQRPDRWFEALKLLTKQNPAADSKSFDDTVKTWLEWGRKEQYIS